MAPLYTHKIKNEDNHVSSEITLSERTSVPHAQHVSRLEKI